MTDLTTIELITDDGPMPTFSAGPDDPRGAVVVVQEAFGLTDHIGRVCQRLADAGYHAVAPALFHREGSPVLAYDDFEKVMPIMGTLNAGGLTTDMTAALDHLAEVGFTPGATGVVGFCMGGTVALYTGTLRPLGAAVTYYGGGVTEGRFGLPPLVALAEKLQTPWLGQFGDEDKGIPVEQVEELRRAAAGAAVETEVHRYPGAEHGFNCDDRPSFHAEAAATAWQRTLDWFGQHLSR